MRPPTNTLILTHIEHALEKNPERLARLLSTRSFNVELVALPNFGRIIIVCPTHVVASTLRDYLKEALGDQARVSFSMRDNHSSVLDDSSWALDASASGPASNLQYLELPSEDGSRRFLISPPLSPHVEWDDYGKEEEGPNKKAVYSPNELSHLLWDRLGGFDSTTVRRYQDDSESGEESGEEKDTHSGDEADGDRGSENGTPKSHEAGGPTFDISSQPEILFEDIEHGTPAIVIDRVSNRTKASPGVLPKTAIPPPL